MITAEPLWGAPETRRERLGLALAVYLGLPTLLVALWGDFDAPAAVLRQWLQNVVVGACFAGSIQGLYAVVGRRIRRPLGTGARALAHGAVVLAGASVGAVLGAAAVEQLWGVPADAIRGGLLRIGLAVSTVTVAVVVGWAHLRTRVRDAELREERARQAALLAELRAIQARTNPHFLFNSLNVVASLIEADPARAEHVLERLSELFRYALSAGREDLVPLGRELAAVRDYLAVEEVRFSDRLTATVDVEPGCEGVPVPPFVLQPLVENAVLHGVGPRPGPGAVRVTARRVDGKLQLRVEDDGVGLGASPHVGTGTAWRDLGERLRLRYGAAATLARGPGAAGGCAVTVTLPAGGG